MLLNTGGAPVPSSNQLLTTVAWRLNGKTPTRLREASSYAGAVVQWLRDGLGSSARPPRSRRWPPRPDNGGVYLVPAYAGLGAPHWTLRAGRARGITRGVTAAHIARAAWGRGLPGGRRDRGHGRRHRRARGRAAGGRRRRANNLLMQFQADTLGVPLSRRRSLRPRPSAPLPRGACRGLLGRARRHRRAVREDRRFLPRTDEAGRAALKQG
jgi:glycerol kinase